MFVDQIAPLQPLPPELQRDIRGREAFAALTRSWMARSGWSYAVMADLAEQAVITMEAKGIEVMKAGETYEQGELRIASGHVWRAKRDGTDPVIPKLGSEKDPASDWELVATVKRVFASQLNNLQRQLMRTATAIVFDTYGTLNQYVSDVQNGKVPGPSSSALRNRVLEAVVISDDQGIYGAEEFLSVFLGRLEPPMIAEVLTDQDAAKLSAQVAKTIRDGIARCRLDLVDDWPAFVSCYPTNNPIRLAKIRDVAFGLSNWSADQVRDEEAAVAIALARLNERHGKKASKNPQGNGPQESQRSAKGTSKGSTV